MKIDTLIVGGGPSALILAFILEGNTPYYEPQGNSLSDTYLHELLTKTPNLLKASCDPEILSHVQNTQASSFYSESIQPFNQLLDILRFPKEVATMQLSNDKSLIKWTKDRPKSNYLVVCPEVGGQWNETSDYRTISYTQPLSLPGWPLHEFLNQHSPSYRPKREEVLDYYKKYAEIQKLDVALDTVVDLKDKTAIGKNSRYQYNNVVLSTGINDRDHLCYDSNPKSQEDPNQAVTVIGSGLGAADEILKCWENGISVEHVVSNLTKLKRFPESLYPEYYKVYRAIESGKAPLYKRVPSPSPGSKHIYRMGRLGNLGYAKTFLGLENDYVNPGWNSKPVLKPHVYVIGSLLGDTTVRYLVGGCCHVANQLVYADNR